MEGGTRIQRMEGGTRIREREGWTRIQWGKAHSDAERADEPWAEGACDLNEGLVNVALSKRLTQDRAGQGLSVEG